MFPRKMSSSSSYLWCHGTWKYNCSIGSAWTVNAFVRSWEANHWTKYPLQPIAHATGLFGRQNYHYEEISWEYFRLASWMHCKQVSRLLRPHFVWKLPLFFEYLSIKRSRSCCPSSSLRLQPLVSSREHFLYQLFVIPMILWLYIRSNFSCCHDHWFFVRLPLLFPAERNCSRPM